MRRVVLLVVSVALAMSVFAPVAIAQGDDSGFDDRGMHAQGADDRGFDDRGVHARGMDDRGVDDNAVASPASSASASATSTASPSASASTSPSASPSATPTASASPALPDTGGLSAALVLGPLAMIVGGGLLALGIVRRR